MVDVLVCYFWANTRTLLTFRWRWHVQLLRHHWRLWLYIAIAFWFRLWYLWKHIWNWNRFGEVDRAICRDCWKLIHTSRIYTCIHFLIFSVTMLVRYATALLEAACHVGAREVLTLTNWFDYLFRRNLCCWRYFIATLVFNRASLTRIHDDRWLSGFKCAIVFTQRFLYKKGCMITLKFFVSNCIAITFTTNLNILGVSGHAVWSKGAILERIHTLTRMHHWHLVFYHPILTTCSYSTHPNVHITVIWLPICNLSSGLVHWRLSWQLNTGICIYFLCQITSYFWWLTN